MKPAGITRAQCAKQLMTLETFRDFDLNVFKELAAKIDPVKIEEGEVLFSVGDQADAMYIVVDGTLQAVLDTEEGKLIVIREMNSGVPVGEIALLAGGKRTATVLAAKETTLIRLLKDDFETFMDNHPDIRLKLLNVVRHRLRRSQLARILPQYFGQMDAAVFDYIESQFEWVYLKQGKAIFKKGESGDYLFILINGLLNVTSDESDYYSVYDPVNRAPRFPMIHAGEIVGLPSLLSGETHTHTIRTARDSYLVKMSRSDFEAICEKHPAVLMTVTRTLVKRLQHTVKRKVVRNTSTNIVVFPTSTHVPIRECCKRLQNAFARYGSCRLITSDVTDAFFKRVGFSNISKLAPLSQSLTAWFEELEAANDYIIYVAEHNTSNWTRRCLSRADEVLLLADAEAPMVADAVETHLFPNSAKRGVPKPTLVVIHPDAERAPSGTARWLNHRRVSNHYHLRWQREDDFARLSRMLCMRGVGVALGGGAAKGIAHIGVLRALKEAGVVIDMIGGASMGSIIGAMFAMGRDYDDMLELCRKLFLELNPFNDYTLPVVSLMGERKLKRMGELAYGDRDIEDLEIPFFCVSSNLTTSQLNVHQRGQLWKAVRASSSIPGVIVPVVEDGQIIVDGGLINNLPGDILRRFCGGVIAVEVNTNIDLSVREPEMPSPWRILWNKLHPRRKSLQVPNILEIMLSTVLTGSFMAANNVKKDADLILTPPLENVGLLDFKNMKKTAQIGYDYTMRRLEKMDAALLEHLRGNNTDPNGGTFDELFL